MLASEKKTATKKEIMVINGQYKLVETGLDWQIHKFKKGGDINHHPITKEEVISVDRWIGLPAYYARTGRIGAALKAILDMATEDGIDVSNLDEYISTYKQIAEHIKKVTL